MITILSSLLSRPKTRRKPYTKVVLEISLRIRILVAAYVSAVWSAQHRHISLFTNCSIIDWFMSDWSCTDASALLCDLIPLLSEFITMEKKCYRFFVSLLE